MVVEYYLCELNTEEQRAKCRELNDDGDYECKHYKSWQLGPSVGGSVSRLSTIGKYLDKHNYAYSGIPTPKMMARCQRGLLSYGSCSIQELQQFVARRGLSVTPQINRMSRQELVKCLEDADDENAPFRPLEDANNDNAVSRFLDLPRELRDVIYTMTFEPVQEEEGLVSSELPMRRANRQIKGEVDVAFTRYGEALSYQAEYVFHAITVPHANR